MEMMREDSAQQSGGWDIDEEEKEEQYYFDSGIETTNKKVIAPSLTQYRSHLKYTLQRVLRKFRWKKLRNSLKCSVLLKTK